MRCLAVTDFDPDQPRVPAGSSGGGEFASGAGGDGRAKVLPSLALRAAAMRPLSKKYSNKSKLVNGTVITSSVFDATRALYEGRKVELNQPKQVSTLVDHLGQVSARMIALEGKSPNFNLCKVSVPGTNLFCAKSKGIPRVQMPVVRAEEMPKFTDYLAKKGYPVLKTEEFAANLKATQNELAADKVFRNAQKIRDGTIKKIRTIVSKDNYILDGHHRWAARIGLAAGKGKLEKMTMKVARVNADILTIMAEAKKFTGGRKGQTMSDMLLLDIYKSGKALPAATKKLSGHAKLVWRKAFNSAFKQYKGDEQKAFAVAWAAANKVSDAIMEAGHRQAVTQDQDEDDITLTQAALLKLMEYGREDAKGDLDLHKALEHVAKKKLKKGCVESGDLEGLIDYDPDQERDDHGKWTSGPGANAGKGKAPRKPEEVSRAQTRRPSTMTPALHRKIEKEAMAQAAAAHARSQMSPKEAARVARRSKRDAWPPIVQISPREVITPQLPSTVLPDPNYDQLKPRGAWGTNSYGQAPGTIPLPTSGFGVREITANFQVNELKGPDGRSLIFANEQEAKDRAAQLGARTGLAYESFRAD